MMSIHDKRKTPPGQEEENTWVNIIDGDDDDVDVQESREPKKPCLEYRNDYSSMIMEAITKLDKPNGSCFNDIAQFIEERYKVPQNFKSILYDMLGDLVPHRKIDKARSCFKMKNEPVDTSLPQLAVRPPQASGSVASSRAFSATSCTAKPEDMETFAAEAVKDCERMTQIFKNTGSTLEVLKYIHENGTIILNASSAQTGGSC